MTISTESFWRLRPIRLTARDFGHSYPDFRDLQSQAKSFAGFAAYRLVPVNVSDKGNLPERYYCAQMSGNGFFVSEQKPALGRSFSAYDERRGAAPVVVLSYHVWQDRYGKDSSIIGKTIRVNDVPTVVVGVMPPGRLFPEETDLWTPLVPDTQLEKRDNRDLAVFGRLADGANPLQHDLIIYLPYAEEPRREMFIVSRTRVPPASLSDAFRREIQHVDANLPVYEVRTLENRVAETRLAVSLLGGMFEVFAGIALVLATVGIYAVIAHSISQRTQEIGLRMAVGGTSRDILKLAFAEGIRPLAVRLALGLPAAFGVTHVLHMVLIGVSPGDPITFLGVVLVLIVSGALGCAIPARRAMRVDPAVALHAISKAILSRPIHSIVFSAHPNAIQSGS